MAVQSMTDINELRASIEKRVANFRTRLDGAKMTLQSAEAAVRTAESQLAEVTADAEKRLTAIRLVEEMLAEADGRDRYPYREMSQEDAMRKALISASQSLTSRDLAEALKAGGYPFTSNNPANAIIVAANVNRKKYFVIEKEGNRALIGLVEWREGHDPFDDLNDTHDSSDIGPGSFGFSSGGT